MFLIHIGKCKEEFQFQKEILVMEEERGILIDDLEISEIPSPWPPSFLNGPLIGR